MRGVFGYLSVGGVNGWTEFGFKNVDAVGLQQLVLAIEPLVDFTGNFPTKSLLSGSVGIPVDGGVTLRPYDEELPPDRGNHCS
jgi:hypothetical protein